MDKEVVAVDSERSNQDIQLKKISDDFTTIKELWCYTDRGISTTNDGIEAIWYTVIVVGLILFVFILFIAMTNVNQFNKLLYRVNDVKTTLAEIEESRPSILYTPYKELGLLFTEHQQRLRLPTCERALEYLGITVKDIPYDEFGNAVAEFAADLGVDSYDEMNYRVCLFEHEVVREDCNKKILGEDGNVIGTTYVLCPEIYIILHTKVYFWKKDMEQKCIIVKFGKNGVREMLPCQ